MSLYVPRPPAGRQKLGLSLAGGGFRASLFHIGVLRRLAEMDLLRYVEVLSTVSGGSIVGALYVLMLKQRLDAHDSISRDEYVDLVRELERDFVKGIQKDLRTRLIMNPLGMLSVLISHDGLGRRMGRIYQRYLYRGVVEALGFKQKNRLYDFLWPGWMPLRQLRFTRPMPNGIDAHNQTAVADDRSAIPNFILNATSLNSGTPFRLSSLEIGDPRSGYFRYDEADILKARKELLDASTDDLDKMLKKQLPPPQVNGKPVDLGVVALAQWWVARDKAQPVLPVNFGYWSLMASNPGLVGDVVNAMCQTNFGRLRQLKLPAWYVLRGPAFGVSGGLSDDAHLARFAVVLREVDPTVSNDLVAAIVNRDLVGEQLLDFAIELYYLRSAEVASWRLKEDFEGISLGTAVAASANFPPVFPPLTLLGIYDDIQVARLGLSDGGVFDNMGITTLVDEGCTHIIASDTGSPFDEKQRVSSGYVGMIGRLPDILMEDVAEQQRTQLRNRARFFSDLGQMQPPLSDDNQSVMGNLKEQYGLEGLAFFSIDSLNPRGAGGIPLEGDPQAVSRLRTDLDSFGDMEVAALINTGYDHADRFLNAYLAKPPFMNAYWGTPAAAPCPPTPRYRANIARVLEVGQSRLFRSLLWLTGRSALSVVFVLAIFGIAFERLGFRGISTRSLVSQLPDAILSRLENPFPLFTWLEGRWAWFAHFAFLRTLAATLVDVPINFPEIVVVVLFMVLGWPWIVKQFRKKRTAGRRKILTFFKWVRAFAPALFLLAGLTPIWIALGLCVVGCVSYVFFNLPYLWATKMK